MPAGRPSSFKPEYTKQAEKLCELGATDVEMADFFNVAVSTFYSWKNEFSEFTEALKSGKVMADERVERSLYHRAIGYSFDAVKIMAVKGEVQQIAYREHVPPDTTACIFWLKNRRSDQWRDVHKHEHGQPGDFDQLSDEDLLDEIDRQAAELGVDATSGTEH